MVNNAFLFPEVLQDTPRLFTAIAEWLAIFEYFLMYRKKIHGARFVVACIVTFTLQVMLQFVAGIMPLPAWIPMMGLAVGLMYLALFIVLDIRPLDCGVLTIQSFVLAEFAASLYRQIYVWIVYLGNRDSFKNSVISMIIIYAFVYIIYYQVEHRNFSEERAMDITGRELVGIFSTGIGIFIMANLSFVWTSTPFSVTANLLYVRTLVNFGGMQMLMTQMGRRNEINMKAESNAVNQLLHHQYEQYKLAVDNSELLRKEMHDMKHLVAALKNENDPQKRAVLLEDMEQDIAIQEAFMNTGNQVLDVILTTKSLQCEKHGITLNIMIDGECLQGIYVKDLCALFGNILDNAIEATLLVENKEKRLITLTVKRSKQFIVLECTNYSESAPILDKINMPRTTKKDTVHHGYGLKSIKQITEKYDGALSVSFEDGWFKLKALLGIIE